MAGHGRSTCLSAVIQLEELPLPYVFDVVALDAVRHEGLREHIARVGVRVYEAG
ncbi:MAG: hypothetical protein H6745_05060 [Deltaproteobacteria bacterium]|nr:hypothetical protein [Deltaproteobacteria bacterium]